MTNLISIPDKNNDYQRYMVFVLCILWTAVIGIIVSFGFLFFPQLWLRYLTFLLISILVAVFNLSLIQLGHTRLASWTLTIMVWLLITIPCYSGGGIASQGILSQGSVVFTAGLLLGWRGGLAIGLLTILADFVLAYLEVKGLLPTSSVLHTPITRWIGAFIPFGTILALQYFATNHLRSSFVSLQNEMGKREEAEKSLSLTVANLQERVKELKTLFDVGTILQNEDITIKNMAQQIAEILPSGWQYSDIAAARVCIGEIECCTSDFVPSAYSQQAQLTTKNGTKLCVEVVYLQETTESDEGPFLKEERHLLDMLAEMIKINLESRVHQSELRDYKFALDLGSIVSVADADGHLTFVNDNFCKISKYSETELINNHFSIISSDFHPPEYFKELAVAMQAGRPYRGEFLNKAKDDTFYWVDTTIVPFIDENGKVYQYLSINHDITERKNADDKIKESERLLKKITSQVPGNTYMFEIEESGHSTILYLNKGTDVFNHNYDFDEIKKHPELLREVLYENDKAKFNDAMKEAYKTNSPINFQYRIVVNGHIRWRWMQAVPEKNHNGKVLWYGATSDITPLVDYIASIEQIIFDIGHVIRRPVTTMLGMSKLIMDSKLNLNEIKEMSEKFYHISEEMDKFIRELNKKYQKKKQNTDLSIDISPVIDKRDSLFM